MSTGSLPEWSKGADSSSAGVTRAGSNPAAVNLVYVMLYHAFLLCCVL